MSLLQIAEIFGFSVNDHSPRARATRTSKMCPFRNTLCTKVSKSDPLGVCSFTDGQTLAVVCPKRFIESTRVFTDAGRLAFGEGARIIAAPEVPVLRVSHSSTRQSIPPRRVGKVDFLIARVDEHGKPVDFAALEVQAVYFSGRAIRPAFEQFLRTGDLPVQSKARPDWRSSAQKRLMPQLSLKIPIFRRWGKKFFVTVDSNFFSELPKMKTVESVANSEVTWLSYPFENSGEAYCIGDPAITFTTWDDVLSALREGTAPDPNEILSEIERKQRTQQLPIMTT